MSRSSAGAVPARPVCGRAVRGGAHLRGAWTAVRRYNVNFEELNEAL